MNNANVRTINLNGGTSGSSAYPFTCPENTFKEINGAYSPLNDAHFFGNVIFNMYNDWLGASSLSFSYKCGFITQVTMKMRFGMAAQ